MMEFADAGDLQQRIAEQQRLNTYFSEDFVWTMLLQVTQGLQHLHSLNIAHRDIKSANVFLFKDGSVKIGDFNVSKVTKDGMLQTQTGTPYYASPEVWSVRPYDQKTDIWSRGCVVYEAAALCPPFRAGDLEALQRIITQGAVSALPMQFSHELQRLVTALLSVDPTRRPNCDAILRSPCVQRRMVSKQSVGAMSDSFLLKTIKVPANLFKLEEKLPKARYTDEGETVKLPKIPIGHSPTPAFTPFSNLRSDSQSPYRQPVRERNVSLDMSPSRDFVRKQYYRASQDSREDLSKDSSRRGVSGSRILESVRRSQEIREVMRSRNAHPRHRMFLPGDL